MRTEQCQKKCCIPDVYTIFYVNKNNKILTLCSTESAAKCKTVYFMHLTQCKPVRKGTTLS